MKKYILRLDDASSKRDIDKWNKIESLLEKYDIVPLVGVIPVCKDPDMNIYSEDTMFWKETVKRWISKDWDIAMHGYEHLFESEDGGINPVNFKSEFAGLKYELQAEKIQKSISIFRENEIEPKVFFAPAHTFDKNTLIALQQYTNIRTISDTIATDVYCEDDFYFVPQQAGCCRSLPFEVVTFCYHPNKMTNRDFIDLESFLKKNQKYFRAFSSVELKDRRLTTLDRFCRKLYFLKRKLCAILISAN